MSFILDALKKSEAERQRQAGPTLLEMRIPPPRPRWPPWSVAVGALLMINLGLLGWFLSSRPAPVPVAAVPAAGTAALAPTGTAAPAATVAQVRVPPATVAPTVPTVPTVPAAPAVTAPAAAPTPPGAPAELPPTAATTPVGSAPAGTGHGGSVTLATTPLDTGDTSAASGAGATTYSGSGSGSGSGDDAGTGADTNPADEQPALSRADAIAAASGGHVHVASSDDSLPDYSDLAGTIPLLSLDLHVYSDNPANRYALINMHKAREGDVLPDGERVVRISPQGVIMDYRGQRFVLRQQ